MRILTSAVFILGYFLCGCASHQRMSTQSTALPPVFCFEADERTGEVLCYPTSYLLALRENPHLCQRQIRYPLIAALYHWNRLPELQRLSPDSFDFREVVRRSMESFGSRTCCVNGQTIITPLNPNENIGDLERRTERHDQESCRTNSPWRTMVIVGAPL